MAAIGFRLPLAGGDTRLRARARRIYASSTTQRIDLNALCGDALQALPDRMDGQVPLPVLPACPLPLDALFGPE
ncbi:MAG: hypothetical protein ACJ8AI_25865 [Rhodopila sp.]